MKKTLYILGIVCTSLMLLGSLFKVFHYPGASALLSISILTFCIFFLPLALINNYKKREHKGRLSLYIASFISGFIVLIGALFKIQHWPGASWLLVIGVPLPFVLFLPVYLYYNIKNKSKSNADLIYIMLVLIFIAVFSVLLSLSVSNNVLKTEYLVENKLDVFNRYYKNKSMKLLDELHRNDSLNSVHAKNIHDQSDEICEYINEIKRLIIEKQNNGTVKELQSTNKIVLEDITDKTDMHHAKIVLGLYLPDGRATVLKEKINAFKEETKKTINKNIYDDLVDAVLETEGEKYFKDGNLIYEWSWEVKKFGYLSAISVFNVLSSIENNVRMAEYEALSCMNNKDLLVKLED